MKKIYLTGIKPSGSIHLGNYLGSIKPSVELSKKDNTISLFFIADYHALNQSSKEERKLIKKRTYELLATYIACGINPEKANLYRQSDIPEIFELRTILDSFTPKSLMNTSHAYKAKSQINLENNKDPDENINMGLFNYPLLMASDILLFNPDFIPVGQDQVQHIEITRDIARRFNHGSNKNLFKIPEAIFNSELNIVGTDGRKMSKSYNNTISLFCTENELLKIIKSLPTDSSGKNEPKPLNNSIRELYKYFCSTEELSIIDNDFKNGLTYGEAKELLFHKINTEVKEMRKVYFELLDKQDYLEQVLQETKNRIKTIAESNLKKIKKALF